MCDWIGDINTRQIGQDSTGEAGILMGDYVGVDHQTWGWYIYMRTRMHIYIYA